MEAIRNYVEALFAALPQRGDVLRVKADMLANLEDKFSALLDEGKNEAEATGIVVASIGSGEELREQLACRQLPRRQFRQRPLFRTGFCSVCSCLLWCRL